MTITDITASTLTQPVGTALSAADSALRLATTSLLWITVKHPVSGILGWVPLENIQKMQIGFSLHDLKYRSVGAAFLANQRGEQFETVNRIDLLATGDKRFLIFGALKELFELNAEGPKRVASGINPFSKKQVLKSAGLSSLWNKNGVGSGRYFVNSYINTFPFLSASSFLPSVYIESLFKDEDINMPNAMMITILLRTWTNQWKDTHFSALGGTDPASETSKFLSTMRRAITNTGIFGIFFKTATRLFSRTAIPTDITSLLSDPNMESHVRSSGIKQLFEGGDPRDL